MAKSRPSTPPAPVALAIDPTERHRLMTIGQATYRLRSQADLTLSQGLKYGRIYEAMKGLFLEAQQRDLDAEEETRLSALIRAMCDLATDAPAAVLDGLREEHRCAIVSTAFFAGLLSGQAATTGATTAPRPGKTRSRG